MSKGLRPRPKERMSQKKLDSLIIQPIKIEREHVEPRPILVSDLEYDTTRPEETIKDFCGSIRAMLARYQYDKDQYTQLEMEMQDLLHFIEMGADKSANTGYKLYKRLAEVRRDRRIYKNEIDLLQPVYDAFNGGQILSTLAQIQGTCRTTKLAIDNKAYTVRTDVLDEFKKT